MSNKEEKDMISATWKKAEITFRVIAGMLVPIVIGFGSYWFSNAIKEKEIGVRYVEVALGVLREKPSEMNNELRKWATKIVDHFAPVPLSEKAFDQLQMNVLDFSGTSGTIFMPTLPNSNPLNINQGLIVPNNCLGKNCDEQFLINPNLEQSDTELFFPFKQKP